MSSADEKKEEKTFWEKHFEAILLGFFALLMWYASISGMLHSYGEIKECRAAETAAIVQQNDAAETRSAAECRDETLEFLQCLREDHAHDKKGGE